MAERVTGPSRYENDQQGSDRRCHQRELNGDIWQVKILSHWLDKECQSSYDQQGESNNDRDDEGCALRSASHRLIALSFTAQVWPVALQDLRSLVSLDESGCCQFHHQLCVLACKSSHGEAIRV